jgi:hypothetical protein
LLPASPSGEGLAGLPAPAGCHREIDCGAAKAARPAVPCSVS